jgi:shikimate dehydrogenase
MRYLTLGEVVELHDAIVRGTGGAPGLRDLAALEAAIAQPRATFGGRELYSTLVEKAAARCLMGDTMIRGTTSLIAHIGFPTHAFKAPMIYNPYFEHAGIDAVVVPMGCRPEHYAAFLRSVFTLENIRGALFTMPHKVSTVALLDEATPTVQIAGACNAVRRAPDGRLVGDMFDGEGFVRGLRRKGCTLAGARALVVGTGGVGSAIAASLAGAGVGSIGLFDAQPAAAEALAGRLQAHYGALQVSTGS